MAEYFPKYIELCWNKQQSARCICLFFKKLPYWKTVFCALHWGLLYGGYMCNAFFSLLPSPFTGWSFVKNFPERSFLKKSASMKWCWQCWHVDKSLLSNCNRGFYFLSTSVNMPSTCWQKCVNMPLWCWQHVDKCKPFVSLWKSVCNI